MTALFFLNQMQRISESIESKPRVAISELLNSTFDICIVDDNRTGEIVLRHKASSTLILSDLLYKTNADIVGPGGKDVRYTGPEWFSEGQEELFYGYADDNSGRQCHFGVT